MADDARSVDLHTAIDERPDEATNYLILADHLQEAGDPRGALIVLATSTDEVAHARRADLEIRIGPVPIPSHGSQTWFYGFVRCGRATVDFKDEDLVRGYLDHPSLRHVTSLDFELAGSADERQWLVDAIAAQARPALRTLAIYSYLRASNQPPNGELSLAPLWDVPGSQRSGSRRARWSSARFVRPR